MKKIGLRAVSTDYAARRQRATALAPAQRIVRGTHAFEQHALVNEDGVGAFLQATLRQQCHIQKEHLIRGGWTEAAEAALRDIKLLPDSLDTFKLSYTESLTLKQRHEAAQLQKNRKVVLPSLARDPFH